MGERGASASRHTRTEPSPPAITGLLSRSTPMAIALSVLLPGVADGWPRRRRPGWPEAGLGLSVGWVCRDCLGNTAPAALGQ
jgi:hypothetical protein